MFNQAFEEKRKYYIKEYFPHLLYFSTYAIIKYERNVRAACRY